jgi:hypothetical protein
MKEAVMTETQSAVRYDKGEDGIVVLTLDDPTASANTMNDLYRDSMAAPSTGSTPRRTTSAAWWSPAPRRRSSPEAT